VVHSLAAATWSVRIDHIVFVVAVVSSLALGCWVAVLILIRRGREVSARSIVAAIIGAKIVVRALLVGFTGPTMTPIAAGHTTIAGSRWLQQSEVKDDVAVIA